VQVQVSRVDLDGRKIDFRLVADGELGLLRAPRDKAQTAKTNKKPRTQARGDSVDNPPESLRHLSKADRAKQALELVPRSPIKALKSSVKKAAASAKKKVAKKTARVRKTKR
jgi:ribonuclease R